MAQMTTPQELFEHELQDIYYAERVISQMLPTLAREATSSQLSRAFEQHLKETRDQIENLEQVFSEIGKRAQGEQCPGIEGIKREHDVFMQEESPANKIRDMFLTGAAARTEHYEIAAYTGLVAKARALGETEAAKLLNENLKQEKDALKKVETIEKDLLKSAKPNGRSRSSSTRSRSSSTRRSTSTSRRGSSSGSTRKTTASSRRTSR
jgi:ferritin-like metal-binding protein YciE